MKRIMLLLILVIISIVYVSSAEIIESGTTMCELSKSVRNLRMILNDSSNRCMTVCSFVYDLSKQLGSSEGPIELSDMGGFFLESSWLGITKSEDSFVLIGPYSEENTIVIQYKPKEDISYYVLDTYYIDVQIDVLFSDYNVNEFHEVLPEDVLAAFDSLGIKITVGEDTKDYNPNEALIDTFTITNDYDRYTFYSSQEFDDNDLSIVSMDETVAKVGYVIYLPDKRAIVVGGLPIKSGTTEFIIRNIRTEEILATIPVVVPKKGSESRTSENTEDYIAACFQELSTYLKNPSSAQLIRNSNITSKDQRYELILMDISASNSFGGMLTDSYFIICNRTNKMISAISFEGTVSHFNDIIEKNKMYARILTLQDGVGGFISNQCSLRLSDAARYLYEFYDSFYK